LIESGKFLSLVQILNSIAHHQFHSQPEPDWSGGRTLMGAEVKGERSEGGSDEPLTE
jgi:hypothetical protein